MLKELNKRYKQTASVIRRNTRLETGFSMLEAVVVVGVLLALAVGGFLSYGSITENAKKAAVKSVASKVYTAAQASNIDGDASTKFQDVFDNYNKSNDKVKVELGGPVPVDGGDFCVLATDLGTPDIKAFFGNCENGSGPVAPGDGTNNGPVDSDNGVFTPLTVSNPNNHVISSNDLSYMNALLSVFADPKLVNAWNVGDDAFWAQDNVNYWFDHELDPILGYDWGNIYMNLSASDPAFAAQKAAMDTAYDNFYNSSNVTDEMRQAVYDSALTVYKKMIASNQNEYRLVASPSFPDDLADRSWPSATNYPKIRVALPNGISGTPTGGRGVWTTSGSTGTINPQPLTVLTDNGNKYIEFDWGSTNFPVQDVTLYMIINDDSGHTYYNEVVLHIQ